MLLELLAALSMMGDDTHRNKPFFENSTRSSRDDFEEADSIFDRNGNEHLLDDDGYCDDCDDYHDCDDWDD